MRCTYCFVSTMTCRWTLPPLPPFFPSSSLPSFPINCRLHFESLVLFFGGLWCFCFDLFWEAGRKVSLQAMRRLWHNRWSGGVVQQWPWRRRPEHRGHSVLLAVGGGFGARWDQLSVRVRGRNAGWRSWCPARPLLQMCFEALLLLRFGSSRCACVTCARSCVCVLVHVLRNVSCVCM